MRVGTNPRYVRESFERFDEEGKKWLTKHQVKCAIASLVGRKPTQVEVRSLLDLTPNQQVDLDLFMAYMKDRARCQSEDEHIRAIFKAFDRRCMGFLVRDDLHRIFNGIASHVPDIVVDEMFDEIDSDGDGRVSCREFAAMMKSAI
ncbi:hypothetical protein BSKO_10350 [Bryopsis sp. KO-2023]|nr:hypothetical protein BSKO_10350 [Bryopsis sp. KO-2023]